MGRIDCVYMSQSRNRSNTPVPIFINWADFANLGRNPQFDRCPEACDRQICLVCRARWVLAVVVEKKVKAGGGGGCFGAAPQSSANPVVIKRC